MDAVSSGIEVWDYAGGLLWTWLQSRCPTCLPLTKLAQSHKLGTLVRDGRGPDKMVPGYGWGNGSSDQGNHERDSGEKCNAETQEPYTTMEQVT